MTRKALHAARPAIPFAPVTHEKGRRDGWTAVRQLAFVEMLAQTGSVTLSCKAVGMGFASAYRLRRRPDAESFRAAWDAAVEIGTQAIRDILVDHALHGTPEEVWFAGKKVGTRRRFNHRSMMWLVDKGDRLRSDRVLLAARAALDAAENGDGGEDGERALQRIWALVKTYQEHQRYSDPG